MLISQEHQIGFIHIPKCGGSTIRHQFQDMSDIEPHFAGRHHHPELGRIFLGHLPLWAVRAHYAEAFALLERFQLYAIVREPHARFESALSQYLHFHHGRRINDFSYAEVLDYAREIIGVLTQLPQPISADHCHFIPQSHYIELDGNRVVECLYPISDIPVLVSDLAAITGIRGPADLQSNETLDFKIKGSEGLLRRMSGGARKLLPMAVYAPLKRAAKQALVRKGSTHKDFASKEADIRAFIADYYARDQEIWLEVSEARA